MAGVLGTASLVGRAGLPADVADRGGVKPALLLQVGWANSRTSSETTGLTFRGLGVFLPQLQKKNHTRVLGVRVEESVFTSAAAHTGSLQRD